MKIFIKKNALYVIKKYVIPYRVPRSGQGTCYICSTLTELEARFGQGTQHYYCFQCYNIYIDSDSENETEIEDDEDNDNMNFDEMKMEIEEIDDEMKMEIDEIEIDEVNKLFNSLKIKRRLPW